MDKEGGKREGWRGKEGGGVGANERGGREEWDTRREIGGG